jgi:phosphate-selective porin
MAIAQDAKPVDDPAAPAAATQAASAAETARLRAEVAELRAQLQRLLAAAHPQPAAPLLASTDSTTTAPLLIAQSTDSTPVTRGDLDALQKEIDALKNKPADASGATGAPTAGWNGEHFYLKSSDGNFTLLPTGFLIGQYTDYGNEYGTPPNTFGIRAANIGFVGSYGKQLDYGITMATVSTPNIRDAYMIFKPSGALNITAGQFKVPFSMEVGTGDTAVDFYNRSPISVLYPDAGGFYRAPGLQLSGEFSKGFLEYQVGAFNGQGLVASSTTNEPELVARLRVAPFKNSDIGALSGLAVGASVEHSRSKALANELSFSGTMNDNAYTFFPQFRINGNVNRYNFFLSYLNGPLGIRSEYVHLVQDRDQIGAIGSGGLGIGSLPSISAQGFYLSAIYFLTGEDDPLNAAPRVKHPVIGPASPGESGAPGWGAWAVKLRYSHLQADAPGSTCDANTVPACPLTPNIAPEFNDHTDQYAAGVNWYLNYWVSLKTDVIFDRLKDPSVQGINPRNYTIFVETLQFRF